MRPVLDWCYARARACVCVCACLCFCLPILCAMQCSHEIHTQGDAFECAFVSVVDAVNFALDVQVTAVHR